MIKKSKCQNEYKSYLNGNKIMSLFCMQFFAYLYVFG